MTKVDFNDLLDIRVGGPALMAGGGDTRVVSLTTLEQWQTKAQALREIYRFTLGPAPYGADIELNIRVIDEVDRGDHFRRTIRYNTGPDEPINALMLIPKNLAGKAPAMLCLHQTIDMGKQQIVGDDPSPDGQDLAIALHLVRRGFVTFSYDLLAAGERACTGVEAFDTAAFYAKFPAWSVRGKELYDISRAIDVLQEMPEVDAQRIGSIGHSLGGGHTIHAMSLEPRIKVGVCNCGIWPCRLAKNPFGEARTSWWIGRPLLRPFCLTGKPFPSQIQELMALAAPRALMNISALNDCQYTAEEQHITRPAFENLAANVRKVFQLYGRDGAFACVTHLEGHSFKEHQREMAYRFVEEHL